MKIIVLGAGSFGCTLANVLSDNGHETYLWSYSEEGINKIAKNRVNPYIKNGYINKDIKCTADLNKVNDADLIIVVVPSFALRGIAQQINKLAVKELNFVICTKGLEANTMNSGYQIINEEVEKVSNIAILSGPTHAEELAFKKYTTIVATSYNMEFAKEVQIIFSTEYLRVYTNSDVKGVEIMGAAKNVLAIGAGICDSYPKLGDNAKAALLTRGLRELKLLGNLEACDPNTFYGLTGLGDLIVTATSIHSRNRKFGELLGKGYTLEEAQKEIGMVVEGIYSVKALNDLREKNKINLPIIESIYKGLYKGESIEELIKEIFNRELRSEN